MLDACVRRLLIGEKDRDVSQAIKSAVEEMDKTPVYMESGVCDVVLFCWVLSGTDTVKVI